MAHAGNTGTDGASGGRERDGTAVGNRLLAGQLNVDIAVLGDDVDTLRVMNFHNKFRVNECLIILPPSKELHW